METKKKSSLSSMLLVTSSWSSKKTFKLIPITKDCPFNEGIYDPEAKILVLISKEKKDSFHMMPRLNDMGDIQRLKVGKRENGKDYSEERKLVTTFYEYYIEDADEIRDFVSKFSLNMGTFDVEKYLQPQPVSDLLVPSVNV